jgi:hypothetical protein
MTPRSIEGMAPARARRAEKGSDPRLQYLRTVQRVPPEWYLRSARNHLAPSLIRHARRPSQMAPTSNSTGPEARQSPWTGIVKFLLVAILIGLIYLLGEEMVRHRFFRGGWVDQRDVLKP